MPDLTILFSSHPLIPLSLYQVVLNKKHSDYVLVILSHKALSACSSDRIMLSTFKFEKFEGAEITGSILEDAAGLFSANYGIWGPFAESKMGSFAKQGRRIRLKASHLKAQCLPDIDGARHVYIRVMLGDILVGNVFATLGL